MGWLIYLARRGINGQYNKAVPDPLETLKQWDPNASGLEEIEKCSAHQVETPSYSANVQLQRAAPTCSPNVQLPGANMERWLESRDVGASKRKRNTVR